MPFMALRSTYMFMVRALSVDSLNGGSTDVKGQPQAEKIRGSFCYFGLPTLSPEPIDSQKWVTPIKIIMRLIP